MAISPPIVISNSKVKLAFPNIPWENNIVVQASDRIRDMDEIFDTSVYMTAVKQNPMCLWFIKQQTKLICTEAIKHNPRAVLQMKNKQRYAFSLAVAKDPSLLIAYDGYIHYRTTYDLIRTPSTISYLSDRQQCDEITGLTRRDTKLVRFIRPVNRLLSDCTKMVKDNYASIRYVPPDVFANSRFHADIVSKYPCHLKFIIDDDYAVGLAIKKAPSIAINLALGISGPIDLGNITPAAAKKMLSREPGLVGYLKFPLEILHQEIIHNPVILTWVGVFLSEAEKNVIYDDVMARDDDLFKYMVSPSENHCRQIVDKDGKRINEVPFITSDIYRRAVLQTRIAAEMCQPITEDDAVWLMELDPSHLRYVRDQTDRVILAAIRKDGLALKWVINQTETICEAAVNNNPKALEWAKYQNNQMCVAAINSNPQMLKYVMEQNRELCSLAVAKDYTSVVHVRPGIFDEIIMMDKYDSFFSTT